jgi:GNAT superfamily N-acetyltransferase
MKAQTYTDEAELVAHYETLAAGHKAHAMLAKNRVHAFRRSINNDNPFRAHGSFINVLVEDADVPLAHASVVIDSRMPETGVVGFLEIVNRNTVATDELFKAVRQIAATSNLKNLCGPINFNTWSDFRYVVEDSGEPPFFLEPYSQDRHIWEGAGFVPRVSYVSSEQPVEESIFKTYGDRARAIEAEGVVFGRVTEANAMSSAVGLHAVAVAAFSGTWAFVTITADEFAYMYGPQLAHPEIFLIQTASTSTGEIIGFLVSAPDLNGEKDTMVLKSIAVHPNHRKKGVATGLFFHAYRFAADHGFRKFIYSTMLIGNTPIKELVGDGEVIRTYAAGELLL